MARCEAKTNTGSRCKNSALNGSVFCFAHRNNQESLTIPYSVGGALLGLAISATPTGAIIGAVSGALYEKEFVKRKKVFVSFDFTNDRKLKHSIIAQSKLADSPFSISDFSLKEAAPEKSWEKKARDAIAKSELVIVLVGPKTYRATGVLKEVQMARQLNKRIIQMVGYKNKSYRRVVGAGRLYKWNWENLKNLLE